MVGSGNEPAPRARPPSSTPRRLSGAWRRRSFSINGGVAFETADVLWLQVGDVFADLRTSLSRSENGPEIAAFSGRTEWDRPHITFVRDIDLDLRPNHDRAELEFAAGALVERGTTILGGRTIAYTEVWIRQPLAGEARHVSEERRMLKDGPYVRMRTVALADLAITIVDERPEGGGFGAGEFHLVNGVWERARQIGQVLVAPPPLPERGPALPRGPL